MIPIIIRIIGEISNAVSACPPKAVTSEIYGVPRNAPMFSPASVMLDARNDLDAGTSLKYELLHAGRIQVDVHPPIARNTQTIAKEVEK